MPARTTSARPASRSSTRTSCTASRLRGSRDQRPRTGPAGAQADRSDTRQGHHLSSIWICRSRRGGAGRAPWCDRRAAAGHRRGGGDGQPAKLQPQPVRHRYQLQGLWRAARLHRPAAVQPRAARAVSAGLDHQADDGRGRPRCRGDHAHQPGLRPGFFSCPTCSTSTATGIAAATAGSISTAIARSTTPISTTWRTSWASIACTTT